MDTFREFLIYFLTAGLNVLGWEAAKYLFKKDPMPYKWTCLVEGCGYKVSGNSIRTVDAFASAHHHEEI